MLTKAIPGFKQKWPNNEFKGRIFKEQGGKENRVPFQVANRVNLFYNHVLHLQLMKLFLASKFSPLTLNPSQEQGRQDLLIFWETIK